MKKFFYISAAAVLVLIAGNVWPQWMSYHDFEGRCLDCHLVTPKENEAPGIFLKDISKMCERCHKGLTDLSHPVDVVAKMKVPGNLPLDRGSVTCVTCHFVHKEGYGSSHLRSRARGEGFCVLCHGEMEEEKHQTVLGSVHLKDMDVNGKQAPQADFVLDPLSLRCLECHDAVYAGDVMVESRVEMELRHRGNIIGQSHPVGVSYYDAKRKYHGAYRDVSDLPPEIRLFDGTVGCGTCHNPYSKNHADLVMSNEKSALCLACHVK